MRFKDGEIDNLDVTNVDHVARLIIHYLCGEKYSNGLCEHDRELLATLIANAKEEGLNYEQFNELLLLLNQDRVEKDFFKFFFEREKVSLHELKDGVVRLRGFAMLRFGNFRFAYKQLIQENEARLREETLKSYCGESPQLEEKFKKRRPKMLEIDHIERDHTSYLGEISAAIVETETKALIKEFKKAESQAERTELSRFAEQLIPRLKGFQEALEKAFKNADIYLTWDYMDVYVATSMRNKWEFEETFDFIREVFEDTRLQGMNLRYFDPTQCKCSNPRDKGLIEGLMLKRALCTIYLAQESDTMGKDCELAATLAQCKPVIAYVPDYKPSEYSQKIREYPLDFFKKRLQILAAEGILADRGFARQLKRRSRNLWKRIDRFLQALQEYRRHQPFSLWTEKENQFKHSSPDFLEICDILAIAECYNLDKRAELLKGRHPLSMQVDLQHGVANGVLVVRRPEECAELLHRVLTNTMGFTIKHRDEGYTVLEEDVSGSPFRVVTDHEKLTNSFWNLFFA